MTRIIALAALTTLELSGARSGIASGAQNASSRSNPAAPGADCATSANATAHAVATVPM